MGRMNILETYLQQRSSPPHTADAMNLLQEHGIISDLCVTDADVPDCDAADAADFLEMTTP